MATVATGFRPIARTDAVNLLLATAVLFLLVSPELASDASFLLSFSATLGLCLFSDAIDRNIRFLPEKFELRSSVAASLSAGCSTIPVSLGSFGTLSIVSFLSNIAVAAFVLPAMVSSLLGMAAESVGLPTVAAVAAFPGFLCFRLINTVATWAATVPYGSFESIAPEIGAILLTAFGGVAAFSVAYRSLPALPYALKVQPR
jgi:predicted membrane metal-binding protein